MPPFFIVTCPDSSNHAPIRSWPLFKACAVLLMRFRSDPSTATRPGVLARVSPAQHRACHYLVLRSLENRSSNPVGRTKRLDKGQNSVPCHHQPISRVPRQAHRISHIFLATSIPIHKSSPPSPVFLDTEARLHNSHISNLTNRTLLQLEEREQAIKKSARFPQQGPRTGT
jgi:hypothetical protein